MVDAYRRSVWTRETWCCKEMGQFSAHFWNMPNPPAHDDERNPFGTLLQIRGATVNYCPFCGVKVQ